MRRHPKQELSRYFDELLTEMQPATPPKTAANAFLDGVDVASLQRLLNTLPIEQLESCGVALDKVALAQPEPVHPLAREETLDVMMVTVAGVSLSLPLLSLAGVYKKHAKLHQMPGQLDWSLGIQHESACSLKVIDTCRLLMPERRGLDSSMYVIGLQNSEWALAVDQIKHSCVVASDDIKWRQKGAQASWIIGTAKETMSMLVDVESLLQWLPK